MIGSLSTATIALTPAGRAELEQELRLLRLARLPELAARLTDARGVRTPGTRPLFCGSCTRNNSAWSVAPAIWSAAGHGG